MPKRPDAYYRPENLDEALALLSRPDVAPLGGGTHLLSSEAGVALAGVVDLQALGLNQMKRQANHLEVGATVTLADLAEFLVTAADDVEAAPLLRRALKQAGPNTYRNAATLGGVVASRLPDSELLAALLVLETQVMLRTPDTTSVPLTAYLAAAERPSGLITAVSIPLDAGQGSSARVARTPADYPIVAVTGWLPESGTPRLAATGVGERPLRLTAAEDALAHNIDADTVEAAAQAASAACTHPGDFRGDAAYRADMVAALSRRVVMAWD